MRTGGTKRLQWASAEQKEAFEYGPAPLCLNGGLGGAKTLAATRKILYLSDLFPGNRGVIARRVGDELRKTTMMTFFKDCPPEAYMYGGRRSDQAKILNLNPRLCADGVLRSSEILFLHLDDPESQHILRGLEINWFLLDQAEEIEEGMFFTLLKRLGRWDQAYVPPEIMEMEARAGRPWAWWNTPDGAWRPGAKPIPPTYAMLTCNPDLEDHWIWRCFHEDSEEWQETYRHRGYKMITFNPLHNRFLSWQNRKELLAAPPEWRARFVEGKWGRAEGTIHKVPDECKVEGTPEILEWIQNRCTLYRILDHGDTSPTCCLWCAVDDANNCYVYREYYMPGKRISFHRQQITSLSGTEVYTFNLADPDIFTKHMQHKERRFSVSDEYSDTSEGFDPNTALFWSKADNDEMGTRNRINEHLAVDPERIHPFTHQPGSPRIFFIMRNDNYPNGVSHALRELRSQRYEKIGEENGREQYSDNRVDSKKDPMKRDDAYDCIRYFIASRPPEYRVVTKTRTRGTMLEARMKLKKKLRADPKWREAMRTRRLGGIR